PMLTTFVLAAIDMHLLGKYRWTLVFGVLATLGRPEAGPWLALWGLWAWIKLPSMRWMLLAGAVVVAFGWFGIPTITNGRPLLAGARPIHVRACSRRRGARRRGGRAGAHRAAAAAPWRPPLGGGTRGGGAGRGAGARCDRPDQDRAPRPAPRARPHASDRFAS